ncbi:MAG TPA: orotidine-5'-phosphate decarboxylase [Hyphomicrobiaceae bacterium]|jgi:orotidine-5'-phosphate decarboxylase|nr:orotidine-5'-phosphate decarboxylase [Hyphomicrobiaceae bacterium]
MANLGARERLIVALDTGNVEEARGLVRRLGDAISFYKIGLELVMSGGLDFARALTGEGKQVFLDMKLLDIENTVERATRNAAATGATFLTVHGHDLKTLRAAVAGKSGTSLRVLAVTVLTNLTAADLAEQGLREMPEALVARRARLAHAAGCDGIVAAGAEASVVRAVVGPGIAIVTPGIRLAGDAAGDQARITPPGAAILAGADYLVVGRPITGETEPRPAVERYLREIEGALARRSLGPPS